MVLSGDKKLQNKFFDPKMSFKTTCCLYFFNKKNQVTCKNK